MAAKKGAVSKSAGLDELKADLKAETLKNAYIFYGEETYLRQSYLDQVREALVPAGFEEFNYHRLGGKGLSMQALQETVEAMPMMAQHTLVTVTDLDIFKLDMSARGAFIEIISDIPEYCTVIFIYDLVAYKRDGKMKKLVAALDEHVREVEFCQQDRELLLRWIKRRFAADGHDIDAATADHLLFTCGSLMTDLLPEIGKVSAFAKGQSVTIADINAVVEPRLEARVFDMTRAITAGSYNEAAHILGELLRQRTEPIMILAAVGKELRQLYTARMALDAGTLSPRVSALSCVPLVLDGFSGAYLDSCGSETIDEAETVRADFTMTLGSETLGAAMSLVEARKQIAVQAITSAVPGSSENSSRRTSATRSPRHSSATPPTSRNSSPSPQLSI